MYVTEQILAEEAERLGVGAGELFAAQQNVEFVGRLLMPWIYTELFARSLILAGGGGSGGSGGGGGRGGRMEGVQAAAAGLPFLVAGGLNLIVGELVLPWAWSRLHSPPQWDTEKGRI